MGQNSKKFTFYSKKTNFSLEVSKKVSTFAVYNNNVNDSKTSSNSKNGDEH